VTALTLVRSYKKSIMHKNCVRKTNEVKRKANRFGSWFTGSGKRFVYGREYCPVGKANRISAKTF